MNSAKKRAPRRPRLQVGILRSPNDIESNVWAVVDAIRSVNLVAHTRDRFMPIQWGWLDAPELAREPMGSVPFVANPIPFAEADVVVIPGWLVTSGPQLRKASNDVARKAARLLQAHAKRSAPILSLYNGSALLAASGLLADCEVALPWAYVPSIGLLARHPLQWRRERPWHVDQAIWTTASMPHTLEALFDLLKHTAIDALTESVASVLLFDPQRQLAAATEVMTTNQQPLAVGTLELARQWLQTHSDQPYDLAATARAASTSPRTLLRWFSKVYGQTPLEYLHRLRVAHAQTLFQTSYLTVEVVAQRCGYTDVGSFRKLFVRTVGITPSAYRERHQLRASRRQWTDATQKT